ncbi:MULTISPECIES: Uma2 family endonuclease [unclassified Streptomyces]|uniref:Uma2 family endonuclease n=1 Tax=unclassified Streptomyces TaxID=2593676 RepID=UPI00168B75D4|nr:MULTISPECIES: Uma2 family endonuclease [unclassified Streptomyces]MBD3010363.1 Uma2 family endonuclease [Streptomyces sp. 5-10]
MPTSSAPGASSMSRLREALRQVWQTLDPPEGSRVELFGDTLEMSAIGHPDHARPLNRLCRAMDRYLVGTDYAAYMAMSVVHGLSVWTPDACVAPQHAEEALTEDGLGFVASAVKLVVEVVSPGYENQQRDRVRKRRAYAGAGIPVYVLIDDHDNHGTVTVLTSPSPGEGTYAAEIRVPYGTEVQIPEGPAKGFAITEEITGPRRG